ncbi:hypothetical protein OE88DRAFT_1772122 [Heliocybe sulcata]|uniref:Family A G protein-coupled receptor-like protein n=1 Tax=Heliocybe sulcata TaxID=5364 RepID=A0A5C3MUA4_9AGAM|nr:hypothetical protein OE88DRAFT_1772122 [Heliocybe sulcata]
MSDPVKYPYLGSQPFVWLHLLFSFTLIGQASVLFLLLTLVVSKNVRARKVHFINLVIATVIYGIGPWFLLYSGQLTDRNPGWGYCLFSASFKHGSDTMLFREISAILALVVELFCTTRINLSTRSSAVKARTYILGIYPYFSFVLWTLITVAVAAGPGNRWRVQHHDNMFYCTVKSTWLGRAVEIYATASDLVVIVLEAWMLLWLRRMRRGANGLIKSRVVDTSLITRMGIFVVYQIVYLITALTQSMLCRVNLLEFVLSPAPSIILQWAWPIGVPVGVFLIFGLTKDYVQVWKSWLVVLGDHLPSLFRQSSINHAVARSNRHAEVVVDLGKNIAPSILDPDVGPESLKDVIIDIRDTSRPVQHSGKDQLDGR